tara:strand:- start:1137 stop:1580 length:444 start_codon:yes stop_codon:yes gene_type:complete
MAIYFGSHTASDDALDDYETGTWSPSWHSSNGGSVSYDHNDGRYVKIGNKVHLSMYCHQSHSGSNGPWKSIAPFTAEGSSIGVRSCNIAMTDSMDSGSSANFWTIYKDYDNTSLWLFYITKGGGWAHQETGHDDNFTMIASITYETT